MNITPQDAHYLIMMAITNLVSGGYGQLRAQLECESSFYRLSVAGEDGISFYNLKVQCERAKSSRTKQFVVVTASENPTILEDCFR